MTRYLRDIPLAVGDIILLQAADWKYARQLKVEFLSSHPEPENRSWYLSPYPKQVPRGRKPRCDLYEVELNSRIAYYALILYAGETPDATPHPTRSQLASTSYYHPRRFSNGRTEGQRWQANQPLAPALSDPGGRK